MSGYSPYPGPWSEWRWSNAYNCLERYRSTGFPPPDDFEYDYTNYADNTNQQFQTQPQPQAPSQSHYHSQSHSHSRRHSHSASLAPIGESGDGTWEITSGMMAATLGSYDKNQQQPSGKGKGKGKAVDYSTDASETHSSRGLGSKRIAYNPPERRITRHDTRGGSSLDKDFKKHSSKEFKEGKILKVLWSEPSGGTAGRSTGGTQVTTEEAKNTFGESVFTKVRRLLVLRTLEGKGYSTCLSISTYGQRGLLKTNANPEDHAVIYSSDKDPGLKPGEEIFRKSIKVKVDRPTLNLDPLSRLNYGKIYTLEHNVKVHFIGKVDGEKYMKRVKKDFTDVNPPFISVDPDSDDDPGYTIVPGEDAAGSTSGQSPRTGFSDVAQTPYAPPIVSPYAFQASGSGFAGRSVATDSYYNQGNDQGTENHPEDETQGATLSQTDYTPRLAFARRDTETPEHHDTGHGDYQDDK